LRDLGDDSEGFKYSLKTRCVALVPRPTWLTNAYGYVSNVYTKPAYRRQGIGTELMQQVLSWAKQQEIDVLIVSISEASLTFYERAGFTAKNEWMECVIKSYPG
jgi:GNAT superfamily N-acetyltransferase